MNWKSIVRAAFDGRPAPDDDVVDEFAEHAAAAFEAARAEGCTPAEAEDRVRRQLAAWAGDDAMLRRRPRRPPVPVVPAIEGAWLAGLGGELRYALQLLRRQWGHTLVVVLTMALGVGASTVLFSVAYGVLVKPLPWPDAGRLVRVYETREGSPRPVRFVTNAAYLSWADSPTTIDALGGWSASAMTVTGGGDAERIQVAAVTPGLLPLLDARTAVGRLFDLRRAGSA